MPHTEQEQIEFKRQFAARRRRQILLAIPVALLVILALVFRERADVAPFGLSPEVFGPVFFAIVVAALVFSFLNWRCPACNGYLGRGINPRFCSKCGTELR